MSLSLSLQSVQEILNSYEVEFNKLSDRWFTEDPWPGVEQVVALDDSGSMADGRGQYLETGVTPSLSLSSDEIFLTLYKELYFRHIYAKHKVSCSLPSCSIVNSAPSCSLSRLWTIGSTPSQTTVTSST